MIRDRLRQSGWAQFALVHLVVVGGPLFVILGAGPWAPDLQSTLQAAVSLAFVITALLILVEALMSVRRRRGPGLHGNRRGRVRDLTVILVAYLPNEQDVIISSALAALEDLNHPADRLQLIVAYNTPEDLPVEAELHALAAEHESIEVLRVDGSTSKAENLIAAIGHARGSVTAIIDSDHRLHPESAKRALRWFDEGYDIVQGRCVIRDQTESLLARLVSIEFEQIYGLAHAGRSLLMDTAIFGGANGWWRTDVIRELGFDKTMLTEDIDVSMRSMLAGYKIIHDRSVMTTELPPTSWGAWWKQRTRWAQGWFQVTIRHQRAVLRSPVLPLPLKLYWSLLLTWRELFPLIAIQVLTLILCDLFLLGRVEFQFDPLAGLSVLLTLASGGISAWGTWRLSTPETREAHGPLRYALFGLTAAPYTMLRNTVALVALAREALGDHRWVVTARKKGPAPATGAAASVLATATLAAGALLAGSAALPGSAHAALAEVPTTAALIDEQEKSPEDYLGLVEDDQQPTTLNTTQPQQTWQLAVPGTWTALRGTLTLRLQGAAQLSSRSRIAVSVNGQQIATGVAKPGTRAVTVDLPRIPIDDTHQVQVQVATQLYTTLSQCPPPGDPSATMQILQGSGIAAVPEYNDHLQLADLPGALIDARDDDPAKVTVRFADEPSRHAIVAASVASGAIADERGYPGVETRIVPKGRRATILIQERPGPARLRLSMRHHHPTLTIAGEGRDLIDAAMMLTDDQITHTRDDSLNNAHGHPAAREQLGKVIPLDGANATASGTAIAQVGFNLPGRYEVRRAARLRFDGSVEAPGASRTAVLINGRRMLSKVDKTTGLPLRIDQLLADRGPSYMLGDLRPGDNTITVRATLLGTQPGLCITQTALTSTIDPAGTLEIQAKDRPIDHASLATWPFPMDQLPNWTASDVIIPGEPTTKELETIIDTLAEAQRVTGEPPTPSLRMGEPSIPTASTLILARPGSVPAELEAKVKGGLASGTLASFTAGNGEGVVLAVGSRALLPLSVGYRPDQLSALTVDVDDDGHMQIRTPDITPVTTETIPSGATIKWPLLILGGSIVAMFLLSLRATFRRNKQAARAARAAAKNEPTPAT